MPTRCEAMMSCPVLDSPCSLNRARASGLKKSFTIFLAPLVAKFTRVVALVTADLVDGVLSNVCFSSTPTFPLAFLASPVALKAAEGSNSCFSTCFSNLSMPRP